MRHDFLPPQCLCFPLQIRWSGGLIEVGPGSHPGSRRLLSWLVDGGRSADIKLLAFASKDTDALWEFRESEGDISGISVNKL